MSTPSRSSLRRIGALMVIPVIMLLGACGMKTDLTIHGDTVDQTVLIWDSSDQMSEADCSKDSMSDAGVSQAKDAQYTFTKHDGHPACEIKATNIPLSQFDGKGGQSGQDAAEGAIKITHENGQYDFTMPSRPKSRRCCPTSRGGWQPIRISSLWRAQTNRRSSSSGRGSATIPVAATC